jgi:hypothetical protein
MYTWNYCIFHERMYIYYKQPRCGIESLLFSFHFTRHGALPALRLSAPLLRGEQLHNGHEETRDEPLIPTAVLIDPFKCDCLAYIVTIKIIFRLTQNYSGQIE